MELEWKDLGNAALPQGSVGQFLTEVASLAPIPDSQSPLVFVRDAAYRQMLSDCKRDVSVEQAGVLVGYACQDPNGQKFVVVSDAVLAPSTVGSSVRVQFTSHSWRVIWERLDQLGDQKIIGWYHTHPDLGVFLSGTDLRTQGRFFSESWQIAVVVDPVRDEIGFFYGRIGARLHSVWSFRSGDGSVRLCSGEDRESTVAEGEGRPQSLEVSAANLPNSEDKSTTGNTSGLSEPIAERGERSGTVKTIMKSLFRRSGR